MAIKVDFGAVLYHRVSGLSAHTDLSRHIYAYVKPESAQKIPKRRAADVKVEIDDVVASCLEALNYGGLLGGDLNKPGRRYIGTAHPLLRSANPQDLSTWVGNCAVTGSKFSK